MSDITLKGTSLVNKRPAATARSIVTNVAMNTPKRTFKGLYLEANAIASSCVLSPISANVINTRDAMNAASIFL